VPVIKRILPNWHGRGGRSQVTLPVSDHPVCAFQRWLRSILLMAQPPLLCRNCQAANCCSKRHLVSFVILQSTWAEDRAMLGSNPSADPRTRPKPGAPL